jgi:predicted regulator of Ras-like GTPase activity (Roadblock/LC7/MglB family)
MFQTTFRETERLVIVVQETLDKLKSSSGVLAVILTDLDGAILYTASDMDITPPLVRGMILSFAGYMQQIVIQLDMGKLTELDVETTTGRIMMVRTKDKVLSILTTKQSNLGTVRIALGRALKDLSERA